MKVETNFVKCPKCNTVIDVNQKLKLQLQQSIQKEYELKFNGEKKKLELIVRKQLKNEQSEEIASLQLQLKEKVTEAKSLNKLKADFSKLKREKTELKEKIEAESQERLTKVLSEEKIKIQKSLEQKSQLKIIEKELVINQLNEQLKKAQKKAEQSSTSSQVQGEILELHLEKILKAAYPYDEIIEVSKGINGADILVNIKNQQQQQCGIIAIESKNTKSFSNSWISKLKSDQRRHNADLVILVTEVLPKDMNHFGYRESVWICRPQEVSALVSVLRQTLIKIHEIRSSNENKSQKINILYDFVTSEEFSRQVMAIVESFTNLKTNLEKEKKQIVLSWKERERLIEEVAASSLEIYSEFKLITGPKIKLIEVIESTPESRSKEN